jgi:hypothetical protein
MFITLKINESFQKRKRLVDSIIKQDRIRRLIRLLVTFPFTVLRRWISIKICRLRNTPYRDPDHPSYAAFLLNEWRTKHGFGLKEAAKILGMPKGDYRDVEYGYCQPNDEHWQRVVKKHLRGEVDYTKPNNIETNA